MKTLIPSKYPLEKWELQSSEPVALGSHTKFVKDTVKLQNGMVLNDFYIFMMAPAVMVFPITKDKQIILIRQYKHGTQDIVIEGIAGMVDGDEDFKVACIRELEEEGGIILETDKLIELGRHTVLPTKSRHILAGYIVFDVEVNAEQKLDDHENIEVFSVSPQEAIEMIKSGEIWAASTVAFILQIKLLYPELFE